MNFDKQSYKNREKASAEILLANQSGQPVEGSFSVLARKDSFEAYQQEDHILSYMQLSSELKGRIHNPKYYFNAAVPQKQRIRNMDLLMQIQGWSYYDMPAILAGEKARTYNRAKKLPKRLKER